MQSAMCLCYQVIFVHAECHVSDVCTKCKDMMKLTEEATCAGTANFLPPQKNEKIINSQIIGFDPAFMCLDGSDDKTEDEADDGSDDGAGKTTTWGGNDAGTACSFPFNFNNQSHSECILVGEHAQEGVAWCATTPDYHADGKWAHCGIPPSK